MSDETTKPGEHQGDTLVPDAEEIMAARSGGAERGDDEEASGETDELRREAEELRQQLLRALAETENVRRRAQRDVSDARQYAVTSFARDLLGVADNFARAIEATRSVDADALSPELTAVLEGVQMTERELKAVFERHGMRTIDATGQRFDPNLHQAMFEVETAEVASGTVVQVVQSGAMIGERVLRPAMVGVSKGGPKPGEPKLAEPNPPEPSAAEAPDNAAAGTGEDAAAAPGAHRTQGTAGADG